MPNGAETHLRESSESPVNIKCLVQMRCSKRGKPFSSRPPPPLPATTEKTLTRQNGRTQALAPSSHVAWLTYSVPASSTWEQTSLASLLCSSKLRPELSSATSACFHLSPFRHYNLLPPENLGMGQSTGKLTISFRVCSVLCVFICTGMRTLPCVDAVQEGLRGDTEKCVGG